METASLLTFLTFIGKNCPAINRINYLQLTKKEYA